MLIAKIKEWNCFLQAYEMPPDTYLHFEKFCGQWYIVKEFNGERYYLKNKRYNHVGVHKRGVEETKEVTAEEVCKYVDC